MTFGDLDLLADVVADAITTATAPLVARIAQLEAQPQLKYCGAYQSGLAYDAGALITKNGGLWLATRQTAATPGGDDSGWRLIVKSGGAT